MTEEQRERAKKAAEIVSRFSEGELGEEAALDQLVELGGDREDQREVLYFALGGSDVIS